MPVQISHPLSEQAFRSLFMARWMRWNGCLHLTSIRCDTSPVINHQYFIVVNNLTSLHGLECTWFSFDEIDTAFLVVVANEQTTWTGAYDPFRFVATYRKNITTARTDVQIKEPNNVDTSGDSGTDEFNNVNELICPLLAVRRKWYRTKWSENAYIAD